jgi:hypothetical protein
MLFSRLGEHFLFVYIQEAVQIAKYILRIKVEAEGKQLLNAQK